MILEIAQIDVREGDETSFEKSMQEALLLLAKSTGFQGAELLRSHEFPSRYRLLVNWESVERHVVDWQSSEAFKSWRGLLQGYFAGPPIVEHMHFVHRQT